MPGCRMGPSSWIQPAGPASASSEEPRSFGRAWEVDLRAGTSGLLEGFSKGVVLDTNIDVNTDIDVDANMFLGFCVRGSTGHTILVLLYTTLLLKACENELRRTCLKLFLGSNTVSYYTILCYAILYPTPLYSTRFFYSI